MKIKTADLTDRLLDYAVAIALGGTGLCHDTISTWWITIDGKDHALSSDWAQSFEPSTDPAQGQPILEREGICLKSENRDHSVWSAQFAYCRQVLRWPRAALVFSYCLQRGPTMLVAGLRCFVASRLGDEVEVPDEFANSVR